MDDEWELGTRRDGRDRARQLLVRLRVSADGRPDPGCRPAQGQIPGPDGTAFRVRWAAGPAPVAAVFGELDVAAVPAFTEAVAAAGWGSSEAVTVDFRHATFVDAAGVSALERLAAGPPGIRLVAVPPSVARVLGLCEAGHLLDR